MVRRWTAKSPERTTPRPRAQQGHPKKYADEVCVNWSCYGGLEWPAWESQNQNFWSQCSTLPAAPKGTEVWVPRQKGLLGLHAEFQGGWLAGWLRPSTACSPFQTFFCSTSPCLPRPPETAGQPSSLVWEGSRNLRVGRALGEPGQPGVNFAGRRQT
eukprot:271243-Pelagomonas_calceolata.AAC.1